MIRSHEEQHANANPTDASSHPRCREKWMTLRHAIGLIKPGDRIFLSSGSAVPLGLISGMLAEDAPLGDNQLVHLLTLGDAPYVRPEYASRFRHNALFIGSNVREAVSAGRAGTPQAAGCCWRFSIGRLSF